MTIELKPETERLVNSELKHRRFTSAGELVEALVVSGIRALHEGEQRPFTHEERKEAIRNMKEFSERNRVKLDGVTVKELLHEGHRM